MPPLVLEPRNRKKKKPTMLKLSDKRLRWCNKEDCGDKDCKRKMEEEIEGKNIILVDLPNRKTSGRDGRIGDEVPNNGREETSVSSLQNGRKGE